MTTTVGGSEDLQKPAETDTPPAEPETPETPSEDPAQPQEPAPGGEETPPAQPQPGDGVSDMVDSNEPVPTPGAEQAPAVVGDEYNPEDDYSIVYDQDKNVFQVTYTIGADAEGDQVLDLSKVQDALNRWAIQNGGKTAYWMQPGDVIPFEITIVSESGHIYGYKDGSFTLSTPDLSEKVTDEDTVKGFDGQVLPDQYISDTMRIYGNYYPNANAYTEEVLQNPINNYVYEYYVKGYDTLSQKNQASYGNADNYAKQQMAYSRSNWTKATKDMLSVHGSIENYLLSFYNGKNGTSYSSFEELAQNDVNAIKELCSTGTYQVGTIDLPESAQGYRYNNFYQNLISFNYGDWSEVAGDIKEQFKDSQGHLYFNADDDSWKSSGHDLTVGDYMADKLNEQGEGAWHQANDYFNQLLKAGLTSEAATWVAFNMVVNIDGELTGNAYQNTAWSWYNSIVLEQLDGDLRVDKIDGETGQKIGDDEGEGQTGFSLWYYESETGEPYCCVQDNATGKFDFVKYDPAADEMTYIIFTQDGSLDIDMTLVKDMVYYLQERMAPDGYVRDTTVQIICTEQQYAQLQAEGKIDAEGKMQTPFLTDTEGNIADVAWAGGSILPGTDFVIEFVNMPDAPDIPTPPPTPEDPTPTPTPVDPTPVPVDPTPTPEQPAPEQPTPATPDPATPQTPAQAEPEQPAQPQKPQSVKTGDDTRTAAWLAGAMLSLAGLMGLGGTHTLRRKREQA